MAALIHADLRRIVRKKGFWILHIFLFLLQAVDVILSLGENNETVVRISQSSFNGIYLLFTTIFVYLSVFGDDIRSNVPPSIIGMGMTKGKFLRAKILDCVLLMGIFYALILGVRAFLFSYMEISISARQMRLLIIYGVFTAIRGLCCIAAAVLVQQVLGSSAAGILVLVVSTILLGNILRALQTLYHIGAYDYLPDGLMEGAINAVSAGNLPLELLPLIGIYLLGFSWAACRAFERKELEL